MKLAVQTRPWGVERNRNDLNGVLAEVAAAGYDGFEIGNQHLDLSKPHLLQALAEAHGLAVAGIHAGGEISDPAAVEKARADITRIAEFIVDVGAHILPFSGMPKENKRPAELRMEADNLNRIGELCAVHGVMLCYHNHYWEIQNDCHELQYLCDHTDPALVHLCLDLGWVQRAGGSPPAVAQRFAERIAYVHIKDTTPDEWRELGMGDITWMNLLQFIDELNLSWGTVEQDEVSRPPVESATISRTFLREMMGW